MWYAQTVMDQKHIRNFTIIAHIDHGKSTLADRMLELTETVEKRTLKDQTLDSMDLERERGITIKMAPVSMAYEHEGERHMLNLIDTPGHIDFSYEVSRALKAVEGTVLLVDATQGVQAQTLSVLAMARGLGLTIIPVISKIDSPIARPDEVRLEVAELLDCSPDNVLGVSGKTGEGVRELLEEIVKEVPAPESAYEGEGSRALIFDFEYSTHKGVIVYVRMLDGAIHPGDALTFVQTGKHCKALETGMFTPAEVPTKGLESGSIGYIVTGVKEAGVASVGDTLILRGKPLPALAGYQEPKPVVWASVFPESQDDFLQLRLALERLQLSDPSVSFEEEASGVMGRGFRCGFLGMLHLEIVTERLRREFGISLVVASPSITYEVVYTNGKKETIYSPSLFPDHNTYEKVYEPWVDAQIIFPAEYAGAVTKLLYDHESETGAMENFGDGRMSLSLEMPLRELMRNFFDELKSATSGFASLSYDITELRPADVVRMDILVAGEPVAAFTRVVAVRRVEEEARTSVEKLHKILPRQMFVVKIQAKAMGRIIASETLSAFRKDVTAKLYGGDITRKMKLLEKQKKGKKKMKGMGKVNIPEDVFIKMVRPKE
jgi:GTP-binding protein LepA